MSELIDFGMPVLFVVLVWWASTALILFLTGLPECSYRASLTWSFALALIGLLAATLTTSATGPGAAYIAFSAAIAIWGFLEMALLMGAIVGPLREPCRPGASNWERFKGASLAIAYHELALLAALAALVWLAWGSENWSAAATFGLLWIMRLSAKLNIFLGVTNASAEWLPSRVAYLATYFRSASMNAIFPLSLLACVALVWRLVVFAAGTSPNSVQRVQLVMLATLAGLALLEHVLLMLPIKMDRLWRWGLASRRSAADREVTAAQEPTRA